MDENVIGLIHAMRNDLVVLKLTVHMHMHGDKRYTAEKKIESISLNLNKIWELCLRCENEQETKGIEVDGL